MNYDYKNNDYITIYVKKKKSDKVIEYYKNFNWALVEKVENDKYEDIFDLTFVRPHKIENKDELQLFQVYVEEILNETGKLEKNKHAKTVAFSSTFGVLSFVLLTLGIFLCVQNVSFIGGICLIVLSIFVDAILLIFIPKIFKREKLVFDKRFKIIEKEIDEICGKASKLIGGEHEEHK